MDKQFFKYLTLIALMVTAILTSCRKENPNDDDFETETETDASPAAYTGTWRDAWDDGWEWQQLMVSANEITVGVRSNMANPGSNAYLVVLRMSEITWTETTNPGGNHTATYPKGHKITGTATWIDSKYSVPKADGSGYAKTGDIVLITLYMSADKQSIAIGNWDTAEQEAS
jgi:hypothetical protein